MRMQMQMLYKRGRFLVTYAGSLSCISGCRDRGNKPITQKVLDIHLVHLEWEDAPLWSSVRL